jgi:hypothetical protein
MRGVRFVLVLAGVACAAWGLWLARGFTGEQLRSAGTWLVAGVVVHDAVLAPVVVLLGAAAARLLPGRARAVAAVAFLVWGTVTVAVANVLLGQGGRPDNETLLGRPYVQSWLVLTAALVVVAAVVAISRRPARRSPPRAAQGPARGSSD